MRVRGTVVLATALVVMGAVPGVAPSRETSKGFSLRVSLRNELDGYLSTRRVAEHISAVSLAVSSPGWRLSINLAVGSTRYRGGHPISPNSLWQVGSNTKAFTAVILLQLEAEGGFDQRQAREMATAVSGLAANNHQAAAQHDQRHPGRHQ